MRDVCGVRGCYQCVKARHLCETHYKQLRAGRLVATIDNPEAGETRYSMHVPVVCTCEQPQPDAIGECALCWRKVVTFTHPAVRANYAVKYPDEWERALRLGLMP